MRWAKRFVPAGLQTFDFCYRWYFAWFPTWDNVRYEWVWLEKVARRYYWSSDNNWKVAWDGYTAEHRRCVHDCRTGEPEQKKTVILRMTAVDIQYSTSLKGVPVYTITGRLL